jgi:hypothetical protein
MDKNPISRVRIAPIWSNVELYRGETNTTDPTVELRRLGPPILTTDHVAEMMRCTIGDVRDKVHRHEMPVMRWGQQLRSFKDEVIHAMQQVRCGAMLGDKAIEGDANPNEA